MKEIFWKIYFCLFAFLVVNNAAISLWPDSDPYIYYHILAAFHPRFYFAFGMHLISDALNLLNLIPFYFYVFRQSFAGTKLWRNVFILRIIFEIFGHGYEFKMIKSLFYTNHLLVVSFLVLYILILLPSYYGVFQYAFRRKTA